MLVVDASAMVQLVLERPRTPAIEHHLAEHELDLHAPYLLDVETVSALRRLTANGEVNAVRAEQAAMDLLAFPIHRYGHDVLTPRVWALRHNFSAYDAVYVALAELLHQIHGARLLTADARLARAAREHSDADVIVVD